MAHPVVLPGRRAGRHPEVLLGEVPEEQLAREVLQAQVELPVLELLPRVRLEQ